MQRGAMFEIEMTDMAATDDAAALIPSRRNLDEVRRSWLRHPVDAPAARRHIDLGYIVLQWKLLKWNLIISSAVFVFSLPAIIPKMLPEPKTRPSPPDNYSMAVRKALLFFNAQKSGRLPKSNNITWRGDSGLNEVEGLDGGYYDSGENIKFTFLTSYALTVLSWSLIDYGHKYRALEEYEHARELIKWGTDYLLLTFNSSSTNINQIYSQVGWARNGSSVPDDGYCWQRPEDIEYYRPAIRVIGGSDLAGEVAAALAAGSIIFNDDASYHQKLIHGAVTAFDFARDKTRRKRYSIGNKDFIGPYASSGYYDEYIWGATWLYFATGEVSYLSLAIDAKLARKAGVFSHVLDFRVPSWDNKLPGAMLLLTRVRMALSPGYPFEEMLIECHRQTELTMCSYLKEFHVFNRTKGGLIQFQSEPLKPLHSAASAAFLASLFADYLGAIGVRGWMCGGDFVRFDRLKNFSSSQMEYIMGKNPMNMSYIVGYGEKFPRRVHHRAASVPYNGKRYSCREGWKWRDSRYPNPNNITGALVGGPNEGDKYEDLRSLRDSSEPTLVGNAGLVGALVSLTKSGGFGVEKNSIFNAVMPIT